MTETAASDFSGDGDDVVVTPVARVTSTMSGQPILLPAENPELAVSIFEVAPGAALPQHRHLYPRYGYILSGHLRVRNAETGVTYDFHAGDFAVEAYGQWHSGENPGDVPLKLLVMDLVPAVIVNVEPNVEPKA
jgi:quercetin dioxygenase-like cupin family protein